MEGGLLWSYRCSNIKHSYEELEEQLELIGGSRLNAWNLQAVQYSETSNQFIHKDEIEAYFVKEKTDSSRGVLVYFNNQQCV